jgi:4-carboxymuconolactone decarboxylase
MKVVSPFAVFAETFPDVIDTYRAMKKTYGETGPLDEKTKHLIQVAVLVAIGSENGTRDHTGLALDAGASGDEVVQAVLLVLGPVGMSSANNGLVWVREVIETRETP